MRKLDEILYIIYILMVRKSTAARTSFMVGGKTGAGGSTTLGSFGCAGSATDGGLGGGG